MMKKKPVIWIGLGIAALLAVSLLVASAPKERRHPTRFQSVNHLDHVTFTLNTNPPASSPSQPR